MTNLTTVPVTKTSTTLAPIDPSKYEFVELTDIKDVEFCHSLNFVQWSGGLTIDQYLQREKGVFAIFEKYGFSLTYWALKEKDEKTGEWVIVSACESVCRPAVYKVKGRPVNDTVSHSIGSVFTPKENRGKGYAKIMMTLLADKLQHWKTEGLSEEQRNNSIIALWSDIGLFYGIFGYELTDAEEIKITPNYENNVNAEWPSNVEPLSSSEEIAKLVAHDEQTMIKQIEEKTEKDGVTRAFIAPRAGIFEHTFWRARYVGDNLNRGNPTIFGAKCNGSWILWSQDYGAEKLYTLRVFSDKSKYSSNDEIITDIVSLIQAAIVETRKWKLPYYCIWSSDLPEGISSDDIINAYKSTQNSESSIKKWQREGSLPMYHTSGVRKDLKWVFDGKYAWF